MSLVANRIALPLLKAYKRWLSPMFLPACRYTPTCSDYAMDAIEQFGVLRGVAMAIWRVLRCHPFAKGGYDPAWKPQIPAASSSESCSH